MVSELIQKMLDYAWEHRIGFALSRELDDHTQSLAFADQSMIVINLNWWREREIPFIIAHEISHVLNGDNNALYHSPSPTYSLKSEHDADMRAVDILLPEYFKMLGDDYSFDKIQPIMDQLCIPDNCSDEVAKITKNNVWYK